MTGNTQELPIGCKKPDFYWNDQGKLFRVDRYVSGAGTREMTHIPVMILPIPLVYNPPLCFEPDNFPEEVDTGIYRREDFKI
jgi:hypothetical protein